jgi:uncharacterized membrane protein YhaH (DUF805 family)
MTPRWLLTAAAVALLAATGITLALPRRWQQRLHDAADRWAWELCEAVAAAWDEGEAA